MFAALPWVAESVAGMPVAGVAAVASLDVE